jgi:hypothetical protein
MSAERPRPEADRPAGAPWETARAEALDNWLNPRGVPFESGRAGEEYRSRTGRIIAAISLSGPPDRVPLFPNYTFMPAYVMGSDGRTALSDQERAMEIWAGFSRRFYFDSYNHSALSCSIPLMEKIGYLLYQWCLSQGLPLDQPYRFVPNDWIKSAAEYSDVASDVSYHWLCRFMAQACEAFSGLGFIRRFAFRTDPFDFVSSFADMGLPEARKALENLMEAGAMALRQETNTGGFVARQMSRGFPDFAGGFAKAPFDIVTDALRTKRSTLLDISREPGGLMAAIEKVAPRAATHAIKKVRETGNPLVFMPLHTGDDYFLSPAQFEKFYWKPLKRVFLDLIGAGAVPLVFLEGEYKTRIDYFLELPRASVVLMIDRTDMILLKKRIGDHCCLAGNIPGYLFLMDDREKMRSYCRKLIDEVAAGGGFMVTSGIALDRANGDMVDEMIETTLKYGRY